MGQGVVRAFEEQPARYRGQNGALLFDICDATTVANPHHGPAQIWGVMSNGSPVSIMHSQSGLLCAETSVLSVLSALWVECFMLVMRP